jgi:DNA-directed RNA polymerase II subunit RPB1
MYELYKLRLDYPCIETVMSNHPFDVLGKFGIEAARATLYKQCHMVLSRDGSYVSVRHYQVMVDRMTFSGAITAMTRHGIAKYEGKSPLARATFEQPVEVLLNAASSHKADPLSGVSEQILMGITPNIGTATISVHRTEEYKQMVKAAAEEESDEEDEGWLTFDNSTTTNPFQTVAPPMLQPPPQNMLWNQPQMPAMKVVPMWAQSQHSMPVMQPVQAWNQDVIAAVGGFQPQTATNMFAPPQNMFAPPQNMFAPPQNMFKPSSPAYDPHRPTSPAYDPHRPTSPAYDPNRPPSPAYDPSKTYGVPMSPEYHPDRPVSPAFVPYARPGGGTASGFGVNIYEDNTSNPQGPTTPPYSPTSPAYTPPYSPTSPAYTPPGSPTSPAYPSPTSPEYDEENDVQVYDPMAGYGAEN